MLNKYLLYMPILLCFWAQTPIGLFISHAPKVRRVSLGLKR